MTNTTNCKRLFECETNRQRLFRSQSKLNLRTILAMKEFSCEISEVIRVAARLRHKWGLFHICWLSLIMLRKRTCVSVPRKCGKGHWRRHFLRSPKGLFLEHKNLRLEIPHVRIQNGEILVFVQLRSHRHCPCRYGDCDRCWWENSFLRNYALMPRPLHVLDSLGLSFQRCTVKS